MKKRHITLLCVVLSIVLLMGTILALAADGDPVVNAGESYPGDFFAGGTSVINDGTILGDMIAGAQVFTVTGTVEGDVIGGALNEANIGGNVGGSIRMAGNQVYIGSAVGRNVMVFGNYVSIGPEATVGKNAYLFGSTIVSEGHIKGKTSVSGTDVTLGGTYDGDVVINDMTEGSSLNLLEGTVIKGRLTYKGVNDYQVPSYAKVGDYEYVKISPPQGYEKTAPIFDAWKWVRRLLTLAVYYLFGLLLYKLFPRFFVRLGDFISAKPMVAAGIGIAALGCLVGSVLLLILLLILSFFLFEASVIFFSGFVFTFIATLTLLFANIPISLWLGNIVMKRSSSVPARLAIGILIITAIKLVLDLSGNIPGASTFAGVLLFLLNAAIWIFGTGSLMKSIFDIFRAANRQAQTEELESFQPDPQ